MIRLRGIKTAGPNPKTIRGYNIRSKAGVRRNRTHKSKSLFRSKLTPLQQLQQNERVINEYITKGDLIIPPSAIYTFSDDDESRAAVGLNHPLMKSVSLNAYIAASSQLRTDFIKSCLKSAEERANDDAATAKINDELRKMSSRKHSKMHSSNRHRQTLSDKNKKKINRNVLPTRKMTPLKLKRHFNRLTANDLGEEIKTGGGPADAAAAMDAAAVADAAVADAAVVDVDAAVMDAAVVDAAAMDAAATASMDSAAAVGARDPIPLHSLFTYEKYKRFCALSRSATGDNWKHIIESCFKFMCGHGFVVSNRTKHLNELMAKTDVNTADVVFKLAYSYHLAHCGNECTTELTRAPSFYVKKSGVFDKMPAWVPFIHASGQLFAHSGHSNIQITSRNMKIVDITSKYKNISDIDKRHSFYSMILFIIINMTPGEITDLYKTIQLDHTDDALVIPELLLTNSQLRVEFDNILPHCLFLTTHTMTAATVRVGGILQISTSLILLEHPIFVRQSIRKDEKNELYLNFRDAYAKMVEYLYFGLGRVVFTTQISHNIHPTVHNFTFPPVARPVDIHTINLQEDNYCEWTYYKNRDPVKFVPADAGGAMNGRGMIVNGNNIAIFYDNVHNVNVDTQAYKHRTLLGSITLGYVDGAISNVPHNPIQTTPLENVTDKSSVFYNENSRIRDSRDRIMGHLAALVYYPNDVVHNVSAIMNASNPHFIYVGPFDTDPCYPRAANVNNPITYSRVHAWIVKKNINNIINPDDHERICYELYVVSRGSKTGYDWDAADADIVSGYLNSDRSLNCVYVLKEIIASINANHIPIELNRQSIAMMQIFSVGHSLGGYLSLALSHASVSRNIVSGISHTNITGTKKNTTNKVKINPYIIPIVFDPFITSSVIINSFSLLPYARIHATVAPPTQMFDVATRTRFTDPASELFISFLKKQLNNGVFEIFEYVNALASQEAFKYRSSIIADIRSAHQLEHMNGLTLSYLADHLNTVYYLHAPVHGVRAEFRQQNLKAAHYEFNLPVGMPDIQRAPAIRGKPDGYWPGAIDGYQVGNQAAGTVDEDHALKRFLADPRASGPFGYNIRGVSAGYRAAIDEARVRTSSAVQLLTGRRLPAVAMSAESQAIIDHIRTRPPSQYEFNSLCHVKLCADIAELTPFA